MKLVKEPVNIKPKSVSKATKSSPISLNSKVKVEAKAEPKSVWGNTPTSTPTSSNFTLMDIINEEIKKVNITKVTETKIEKPVLFSKTSPQSSTINESSQSNVKGWNLQNNNSNERTSIAQIIEMEKRSKEQYKKLKNRPLNSIQIEEKAIEDLKKLYQVDLVTDMTITIELIDEADFNNCVPVWKKY